PGDASDLAPARLQHLSLAWRLVIDGRWLGFDGQNHVDLLAARWAHFWGVYADHAGGFVLLRYEDFMADKLRAIDDLARALNLAPTIDITGRLDVQFQPRGDRSVRWCDFYGAANLARIERVCRIGMTACGYGPRPSRRARAVSQS
ncbi:MAG: hypothetical protein JXB36_14335, partial [Gammaproteobacteria bacterium]|nr:hypothetical protein [Gammaproteobacteria bacterium]